MLHITWFNLNHTHIVLQKMNQMQAPNDIETSHFNFSGFCVATPHPLMTCTQAGYKTCLSDCWSSACSCCTCTVSFCCPICTLLLLLQHVQCKKKIHSSQRAKLLNTVKTQCSAQQEVSTAGSLLPDPLPGQSFQFLG